MRGPVQPVRTPAFAGAPVGGGYRSLRRTLVECPFFRLDLVRESTPLVCGGEGRMHVLIMLAGKGHWEMHGREEAIHRGEAWLLPAAMPPMWCRPDPELDFLVCTLP